MSLALAVGTILFTRLGSVLQQPADGSAPAVVIAELPDDAAEVRWVESTQDGRLVVLDFDSYSAWLASSGPDRPVALRGGGCTGRARPSPKGGAVVCPTRDGPAMLEVRGNGRLLLPAPLGELAYRGPTAFELAALGDDGVVGLTCRDPGHRQLLAKAGPRSHLLVAPNGQNAVAVFGEGEDGRVRSFVLDGEGVSRQLGGPGIPTAWSWDSTWVLFQEGDIKNAPAPAQPGDEGALDAPDPFLVAAPPRHRKPPPKKPAAAPAAAPVTTRACVARATGGEVKCWDDFTGMAFAPDSTEVLLRRGTSLYIGKIAGVRPEPPVKIIDGSDGAATWTPGPIAAPLPRPTSRN